ncbi:MAG: hypothetical protein KUG82_10400 [Pseudomonadales bacterium]|nr:hypothetical protein [Pseudomonadales bacterium]
MIRPPNSRLKTRFQTHLKNSVLLAAVICLISCGGGGGEDDEGPTSDTVGSTSGAGGGTNDDSGTTDSSTTTTVVSAFPSRIIVASPTSISSTAPSSSSVVIRAASTEGYVTDYAVGAVTVSDLIDGLTDPDDEVDFDLLFDAGADAECYGPYLPFQHHPDVSSSSSDDVRDGELPSGDLGLWTVTEGTTDEACAAAELNARMENIKDKNSVALLSLASLISAYESDGSDWPDEVAAGSSLDLLTEMNAIGMLNTVFTVATMALNNEGTQWSYHLDLTYTWNFVEHDIVINLEHVPGSTEGVYEGLLTFLVNDTFEGGNCGEGINPVTVNGSLHYNQSSDSHIVLQYRETQFCEHDINGFQTPVNSDDLSGNILSVSSTETFDETWKNNFTLFTAEFDPATLAGSYSFAWQAGYDDSHSRILNLGLDEELASTISGEAYFGFGSRLQEEAFDGGVKGFICNWAGPGSDGVLNDYAQRQHLTLDSELGLFIPTNYTDSNNDSSNIIFAPTNLCVYDRLSDGEFVFGGERFEYDRDLSLTIDSEDMSDVVETVTDTDIQLEFDLMGIPSDSEAESIWGYITDDRGYVLPQYP